MAKDKKDKNDYYNVLSGSPKKVKNRFQDGTNRIAVSGVRRWEKVGEGGYQMNLSEQRFYFFSPS